MEIQLHARNEARDEWFSFPCLSRQWMISFSKSRCMLPASLFAYAREHGDEWSIGMLLM